MIFMVGLAIAFTISEFESRLVKESQTAAEEHRLAEERQAAKDSAGQGR